LYSCGLQSGLGVIEPSSGGVDGTAGDSTVPLISEMQESGSLELDPSTSIQVSKETEKAATLPTESSQVQPVLMEGTLARKHEMEGHNKKASNRLAVVFSGVSLTIGETLKKIPSHKY